MLAIVVCSRLVSVQQIHFQGRIKGLVHGDRLLRQATAKQQKIRQ
jgi:hypothetical protein